MSDQMFKKWKGYSILFVFLWMTSNFFPGSYNVDTWNMYFEMESWDFTDWHSPFMGLLWRLLYVFSDRFFSLYLFQMAWYFLFFHWLTDLVDRWWVSVLAILSSILLVFIPQYLMKDVLMTLSWCSTLIMLLIYAKNKNKIYVWLALLFIAYGLLLRPNAVPALWPLLLVCMDGFDVFAKRRWVKYTAAFLVSWLIFAFYYITLHGILHAKPAYFTYKYRLADVLGISIMSGENFMPECVTSYEHWDQKKVEEIYTPATNDNIYFASQPMVPPASEEVDACVKEAWIKAIKKHPFIYLKSRAIGYIYYLKLKTRVSRGEYWNVMVYVIKNNYIPIDDHHTPLTTKFIGWWKKLDHVFFFDPWLWLLGNIILCVLFYRKYRRNHQFTDKVHIALQLTCIIYQLVQFPFYQIDLDFRFSHLNIVSVFVGALFFIDSYKKQTYVES